MSSRHRLLTGRLLLAVMLLTFLAPGFGWQLVAGHELLSQAAAEMADHRRQHDAGAADAPRRQDRAGEHADPTRQAYHGHDHEVAHGMAGHVLSHMPAPPSHAALPLYAPHQPVMQGAEPPLLLPQSPPDQPYRPPQSLYA